MPEIRQYMPQVAPSGPVNMARATPDQFGSGVGAALEGVGQAVTQAGQVIHQRAVQEDLSNIDAKVSEAKTQLSLQMQDQLQKGTLDHDQFMKTVQDNFESIGNDVNTREGRLRFNQMQAAANYDLSSTAQRGAAELAGTKAVQNARIAMDNRTSYVMGNPGSFGQTLQESDQAIDDMVASGGLPATKAPELKRMAMDQMAAGALRGIMQANPDEAQKQLDSGKWDQYMGENTKYKMGIEVTHFKQAKDLEERRKQALADKAAAAVQEATVVGYVTQLNDPEGPGLDARQVVKDMQAGKIDSTTANQYLRMIKTEGEEKVKSDPHTFNDLSHRLTLPDGDPQKITDMAEINKHVGIDISAKDVGTLYGLLDDSRKTPAGEAEAKIKDEYFSATKNTLIKNPMMPDPEGSKIYQDVQARSYEYAIKAKQQGKSTFQIYSPSIGGKPNPDYVGNHVITPQRSMQDIMKATVEMYQRDTNRNKNVLPRQPKESIEDYMKRSGGSKEGTNK